MQLFLQLASDSVPDGAPTFGSGLLQLFYCTSSEPLCEVDCEAYAPFSSSVVARIIDPRDGDTPRSRPDDAFPPRRIVGWAPADDFPNWEELAAHGIELSDDEADVLGDTYPRTGDKLGGWPAWVQGVEYPECQICRQTMRLIFQIDSEDNLPYMFGDVGTGHLMQCPAHPDVLSFHWACG